MDSATLTALDPKTLGFWTRCIRNASHWSQEAVAASTGLDVRTIQRIEAGKPVSITTRRALARGLGYKNHDIFQDPAFIATVHGLLSDLQKGNRETFEVQFPDHMRLPVARVADGEALGRLADASEATLLHADETLSQEAKEVAASLFDYLRDIGDISDDASFSDKLAYNKEMQAMLEMLERLGASAFSAIRATKMVGAHWADKTPIPITVGYLTIAPSDRAITEIMVPRRLSKPRSRDKIIQAASRSPETLGRSEPASA